MKRTLIALGNSTAVTLPPDLLEQYGLKAGDVVEVTDTEQGIVVRPLPALEPEFEQALRTVISRYRTTLRRLAEYDRSSKPE